MGFPPTSSCSHPWYQEGLPGGRERGRGPGSLQEPYPRNDVPVGPSSPYTRRWLEISNDRAGRPLSRLWCQPSPRSHAHPLSPGPPGPARTPSPGRTGPLPSSHGGIRGGCRTSADGGGGPRGGARLPVGGHRGDPRNSPSQRPGHLIRPRGISGDSSRSGDGGGTSRCRRSRSGPFPRVVAVGQRWDLRREPTGRGGRGDPTGARHSRPEPEGAADRLPPSSTTDEPFPGAGGGPPGGVSWGNASTRPAPDGHQTVTLPARRGGSDRWCVGSGVLTTRGTGERVSETGRGETFPPPRRPSLEAVRHLGKAAWL